MNQKKINCLCMRIVGYFYKYESSGILIILAIAYICSFVHCSYSHMCVRITDKLLLCSVYSSIEPCCNLIAFSPAYICIVAHGIHCIFNGVDAFNIHSYAFLAIFIHFSIKKSASYSKFSIQVKNTSV